MRAFVDQHRDVHGVEPIFRVLQIAPLGLLAPCRPAARACVVQPTCPA